MIALDGTSAGDSGLPTAGPLTFSHTVTSNTNGILIVGIGCNTAGRITGVTYNGDTMTQLGPEVTDSSAGTLNLYGILTPDTGANTVSISLASSTFVRSCSISYTGTQQILPSNVTSLVDQGSTTSQALSLTTVGNPSAIVMLTRTGAGIISAGTGQTIRATNSDAFKMGDSVYTLTPGSNSITSDCDTSTAIAQLALELKDVDQVSQASGFFFMSL